MFRYGPHNKFKTKSRADKKINIYLDLLRYAKITGEPNQLLVIFFPAFCKSISAVSCWEHRIYVHPEGRRSEDRPGKLDTPLLRGKVWQPWLRKSQEHQ